MKMRGFEIARGWENRGVRPPTRSTANSAGYDIEAAEDVEIPAFQPGAKPTLIPTGLKAYFPHDEVMMIMNRSSGPGKGLVLANGVGVVDADFYNNPENDGHFQVLVFNVSAEPVKVRKGDRIAQAIFQKFLTIDGDTAAGVRQGGIGSTK